MLYMSPEAFAKQRKLKSDMWSLGITLIELAEGRNPYEDVVYWSGVIYRVCQNEPPSLSSEKWSAKCVDFIKKCLMKNVKERWSVNQLMEVRDWEMA